VIDIDDDYRFDTPAERAAVQAKRLANAKKLIRAEYPDATHFDLMASDQGSYGFALLSVTLADGTSPELDQDFIDEVGDHVGDIDWRGVVGESYGGYATLPLADD
jgi:hypothetical protein